MKSYKEYLQEMAKPTEDLISGVYYHGTSNESNFKSIIKHGGLKPGNITIKRGSHLTPVIGKVYLTKDISYAQIYAIGGNVAGSEFWDKDFKNNDRYGYLFVINGSELKDIQPDEDNVGELIYKKEGPNWLFSLANKHLTINTLNKIKQGEYNYFASGGKKLLNYMTDEQKIDLINNFGSHIANESNLVKYKEIWKIDKLKTKELKEDGSNFFEIADRIK